MCVCVHLPLCLSAVLTRVVGGMETLSEMERIATDAHDKPQVYIYDMMESNSHLISVLIIYSTWLAQACLLTAVMYLVV